MPRKGEFGMKYEITSQEVADAFEKIQKIIIKHYEDSDIFNPNLNYDYDPGIKLEQRVNKAFLSNGDIIKFKFDRQNLAHLFGIDPTDLVAAGAYPNDINSYELLLKIIDSPYDFLKKCKNYNVDINRVISPYITQKVDAFLKNAFISLDDCEFICKYDKDRSYGFSNNSYNMDYLLVQKREEKYYMIILRKNKFNDYSVVSNQMFNDENELVERLQDIIPNQELTIVNGLNIKNGFNNPVKIWLNNEVRQEKLLNLISMSKKIDCIPNVINDYVYFLKLLMKSKAGNNVTNAALKEIGSLMSNKKVVNISELSIYEGNLSEELIFLIDSYNDSLLSNDVQTDANVKLSETIIDNKKLQEELSDALSKLEEMKTKYNELEAKYNDLHKENEKLSNIKEQIKRIVS